MDKSRLFKPLKVGQVTLQHRIAMAPLTRFRGSDKHVPVALMKEYYGQRASTPGTLLITEGTIVSPQALGYPHVPGLWNNDQIESWKEVTTEVHRKGSFIFAQLWALGRVASADSLKVYGLDVVSSSATQLDDHHSKARELTTSEIQQIVTDFAQAAKNAVAAGFDGVEIHGANGYLVDQFIQDTTNHRTDQYGGSVENRARFAVEVVQAVVDAIGADRTAIRLSPWSTFQGMRMIDPVPQFTRVVSELKQFKLAYLHFVQTRAEGESLDDMRPFFDTWDHNSPILVAGGFQAETAQRFVDERYPDVDIAPVFGRYFISTPDLPYRIQKGLAPNPYDRSTFYSPELAKGYVDYPFSAEYKKEHPQWIQVSSN